MEFKWTTLETSGPVPLGRSSHSTVVIGQKAYIFGGENIPRVPISNIVHCLDLGNRSWSELTTTGDVPVPRNAHTATAVHDVMYVFGGRTGITMGEGSLDDLYTFDTNNNTWSLLKPKGDVPTPRSFHAMAATKDRLYMFGGCGQDGRLNDLHSYDIATNTWKKEPSSDEIDGRGGAGLAVVGTDVFVVGGFAGREMSDVHRYDTLASTWSQLSLDTDLPPRSVFGIASLDSSIFTFFGEIDPSDQGHMGAGGFSKDCYALDTRGKAGWKAITCTGNAPEARGWMTVASCHWNSTNGVLVFGGNNINNDRLNDCHFLPLTQ